MEKTGEEKKGKGKILSVEEKMGGTVCKYGNQDRRQEGEMINKRGGGSVGGLTNQREGQGAKTKKLKGHGN